MRIKALVYQMVIFLAPLPLWAGTVPAKEAADFTLSNPSNIPGVKLQPGSYTIHVVNHLSDRVILKVDAAKGGDLHSTFIGVQNGTIKKPARSGPVTWENPADGASYLKGWYFAGAPTVIEFVYPKAEAVAIATSNPEKVPAVDPASEGKVSDNTLSQDDMQLLTLWVLSLQQVGPGVSSPSIKAERYQLTASVNQKPVIKALPHTASLMPWMWLLSVCFLMAAGSLRLIVLRNRSVPAMATPSRQG
jgi:hypothetical protein